MTVTVKLLRLFRVDQQLRGLQTRLHAAERFLATQEKQLKETLARQEAIVAQMRKDKAAVAGDEGEAALIDTRIEKVRNQMNACKTGKEYQAFQNELNLLKARKAEFETHELEIMERMQGVEGQIAELARQRAEREKMVAQARADRDQQDAAIKDRVAELAAQRKALASEVPAPELRIFEELVRTREDEAMAKVELLNKRDHEYTCAACMMTLPVETLNKIIKGDFIRCSNCQCILFNEEELDLHKRGGSGGKGKKKEAGV